MSLISYDPATQRATLEGGAHNREVYNVGRSGSMSITHGRCKAVGAAGLVLGGGIGFNMRNKGLTCDQLVSTRIVLASGEVITASATENPDVFWAVRGAGGGNFGIHTQFVMQMFPVTRVTWFRLQWETELERVFDVFQDVALAAPPEFGAKFMLNARKTHADNQLYIEILGQFAGDEAQLRSILAPVVNVAAPSLEVVQNLPYWDAQEQLSENGSPEYAHERSRYAFSKISPEGRDAIFRNLRNWPGTSVDAQWKYFLMGGRIGDVANDATAFAFRNATMITSIDLEWMAPDSKKLAQNFAWLDAFHAEMEQYTSRHCYVNFIDSRQANHLDAYYGNHVERLREVKRKLDPNNVFSNPQSVPV
jgi:FAD/FMN-containing dehydrogenase